MPWRDRLLLVEATTWLVVASIAITALPFRHVASMAARPACHPLPAPETRAAMVQRVRWAILACARRVFWRTACFHQSLAAHLMLRRRGVPTVLYYGAAPVGDAELRAHVWVKDGAVDVVGGRIAAQFGVLATFPALDEHVSHSITTPPRTSLAVARDTEVS